MWWWWKKKPEILKVAESAARDIIAGPFAAKAKWDMDDREYAYVTDGLLEDGLKLYSKMLWMFGVSKWRKQFQCEDFSRLLRMCMTAAYSKMDGFQLAESPFVCCVEYKTRNGEGHEVVAMRFEDGWKIYEPQWLIKAGSPVKQLFLTEEELISVTELEF